MQILYLCHRFPYPPSEGGKIRSFNIIKHLNEHHQLTVVSLIRSQQEANTSAEISKFCSRHIVVRVNEFWQRMRMLLYLPTAKPSSMGYFFSSELQRRINQELTDQSYDLIIVHCSSVAPYVEHITHIPKLIDFCDMDSQKWLIYAGIRRFPLSLGYWLEGHKLAHAERKQANLYNLATVATREELLTLNKMTSEHKAAWFPNGVDADYFVTDDVDKYDPNMLSFIGRMDYFPNETCMIYFCHDVLPKIRRSHPNMQITIVGAHPSKKVLALDKLPGVTVTGWVDDVRPYVRASLAMVAPLTVARGTQNKLLEAMALQVPVITSPLAARGVDAISGEHLLTAVTAADYCSAVDRLIAKPNYRKQLALAGRQRVQSHHSWSTAMTRFDKLIEQCRHNHRQASAAPRQLVDKQRRRVQASDYE